MTDPGPWGAAHAKILEGRPHKVVIEDLGPSLAAQNNSQNCKIRGWGNPHMVWYYSIFVK